MTFITLATEDELSEAVCLRLAQEVGLTVHQSLRRGGFGYLKSRVSNFCQMAEHTPIFMLTDLDRAPCAPGLVSDWLGGRQRPDGFIFRVAVREVESWLLADYVTISSFFGLKPNTVPNEPDEVNDPKQELLSLAARASKNIREDLVVKRGVIASQGLGYNARLSALVRQTWSPNAASERSPSLARTRFRLKEFVEARIEQP